MHLQIVVVGWAGLVDVADAEIAGRIGDDNRDPAASVAMAVHALTVAADQSHHTRNALATAQAAINLQGYNLPSVAEVSR